MISFFNNEIKFSLKDKILLKRWVKEVILNNSKKSGDINIIFCSDEKILEINNQFLKHNYYTDIITFNYCQDNNVSGELYISIDTVKANAIEYNEFFENELHRVIIHGILHLLEFDDITPDKQLEMRRQEDLALSFLENLRKDLK